MVAPMSAPGATNTGVSEKSSTARPSSAPEALTSVQRMQKPLPLAMARPAIWLDRGVRLAASLPSLAPVPTVLGVTKSSASTSTHAPSVRPVASRLYWKLIWSVRPAVPERHCSPV